MICNLMIFTFDPVGKVQWSYHSILTLASVRSAVKGSESVELLMRWKFALSFPLDNLKILYHNTGVIKG